MITIFGMQAKRANIAIAMVTNPRVLFLDEPTSGLDSYTSNEVLRIMLMYAGQVHFISSQLVSIITQHAGYLQSMYALRQGW